MQYLRLGAWILALIAIAQCSYGQRMIDGILDMGNGKVYAFEQSSYVRYSKATSSVDNGYPKPTKDNWQGFSGDPITAAVRDASKSGWEKIYLFKEGLYWRFDVATDRVEGSARITTRDWKGIPRRVDAVFSYQDNRMYFFSGNQCYLYLRAENRVAAGYPKPIAQEFPGTPDDLDAAVYFTDNGKIYFFKEQQYYRVDGKSRRVDAGYPKDTKTYWKGLEKLTPPIDRNTYFDKPAVVADPIKNRFWDKVRITASITINRAPAQPATAPQHLDGQALIAGSLSDLFDLQAGRAIAVKPGVNTPVVGEMIVRKKTNAKTIDLVADLHCIDWRTDETNVGRSILAFPSNTLSVPFSDLLPTQTLTRKQYIRKGAYQIVVTYELTPFK